MKNTLFVILSIFILISCGGSKEITDGSIAYDFKKYNLAQELLPKEISSEGNLDNKLKKIRQLALSFDKSNQPQKAVEWYQKGYDVSSDPMWLMDWALAQKRNEDYEGALENFEKYKNQTNDIVGANPQIKICKDLIAAQSDKTNLFIENIEAVNTSKSDYATALYKNEALAISSTRASATGDLVHPWTGDKNPDIFLSILKNNQYQNPENFSNMINSELPEGSITFSKDFNEAYFTRCNYSNEDDSYCKIYYTYFDGFEWIEPEYFPIFSDTVNVGQPFLAPDGNRLYFASDAPFGYGGNDIYYLMKIDGEWSEPYNAGFYVNTEGEELFPSVDSKGNLYFASNGKQGFGGLDIWKAKPEKNSFGRAEQLPYPINTGADDFMMLWIQEYNPNPRDGIIEKAIVNSSRKGGLGNDDVYMYTKKFINFYELNLYIVEKEFEDPNNSDSKVLGLKPLEDAKVQFTPLVEKPQEKFNLTDDKGFLNYELEANTDYKIYVSKNDYFNTSITVTTRGLKNVEELFITLNDTVELEKIFPEKEIVIPNIYYDYDKATLREESLPVLDKLLSFFEENSDLIIEIGSHTDSRGSDSYNLNLSQRRAQSVVDYLISKGIPTEQLKAKGYGETKLVNRCKNNVNCSEEEHQENRRTTFRVISADGVLESQ